MEAWVDIVAWVLAGLLMLAGVAGAVLPVLPGPLLILLGAVVFRLVHGPDAGFGLVGFVVLVLLALVSTLVDVLGSAAGAKWFGSTRWGVAGALVGGVVGIFFGLPGLVVGPLLGVLAFEMAFAKKELKDAGKSSVGTVVGATAGLAVKLGIALAMVAYFVADVLIIGRF
jgi:uncharacterized protein YqgC (DUF456 family)